MGALTSAAMFYITVEAGSEMDQTLGRFRKSPLSISPPIHIIIYSH